MRKLILLISLIVSIGCFAQEKRKWKGNYLLSGSVESLKNGKATLKYIDNTRRGSEEKVKEAAIADGKFAFYDYVEEPADATLEIDGKIYSLYIDPTQMAVIISGDNRITILGSWTNDDKRKIDELNDKIGELADGGKKNPQGNLAELSYASVVKDSFIVLKKMFEVGKPDHPLHSDVRSKQMIGILMNMSNELKDTPTGVRASEVLFISSVRMHTPTTPPE